MRVVRITHRVEIRALHQPNVGQHGFLINDMSFVVVMLVQIRALEFDELAIDKVTPVDDLGGTKTDGLGDRLTAVDGYQQCVQVRGFRRPGLYITQRRREFLARRTRWQVCQPLLGMHDLLTIQDLNA